MNLTETQKSILRILFVEKESSRSILANTLSLTNAALTLALKPLLEEKMISEKRKENTQKVGRKELTLSLNAEYGSFLGIDIRRHHEYFYQMDFAGNILKQDDSSRISFKDFSNECPEHVISIGVTVRGDSSIESMQERYPKLLEDIVSLNLPYYIINNVNCLANIYAENHPEEKNFLLVKYGPGVGSSIYVNGKPLGYSSELGHTYYQDKTVEDTISYSAILGKDLEEKEGTKLITSNEELLNKVIHVLSFALCNANSLLSLQSIILSGELLTSEEVIRKLEKELRSIEQNFDLTKICLYEDYATFSEKKSCIGAFIKTYNESK